MVSLQKESELENLPWQFRFEKLYRKLHGLPDNDPLLTGHCQTFIKAFEQILHEEISNREKEIAEEIKRMPLEYADSNNPLRVIEKILKIILNHK